MEYYQIRLQGPWVGQFHGESDSFRVTLPQGWQSIPRISRETVLQRRFGRPTGLQHEQPVYLQVDVQSEPSIQINQQVLKPESFEFFPGFVFRVDEVLENSNLLAVTFPEGLPEGGSFFVSLQIQDRGEA